MSGMHRQSTEQALFNWRSGQTSAERLCGGLLLIEKFEDVDPQHPLGGPDGLKDVVCKRDSKTYVAACFFPPTPNSPAKVREKFVHDMKGAIERRANGLVFMANQHIKIGEREKLKGLARKKRLEVEIFHVERIRNLLDSPVGYGLRLEFLGIPMAMEEQISFWDHWKGDFEETIRGQGREFFALRDRVDSYIAERLKGVETLREEMAFILGVMGYVLLILREHEAAGGKRLRKSYDSFLLKNQKSYTRFRDEYLAFLETSSQSDDAKKARKDHLTAWGHMIESVCKFVDPEKEEDEGVFDNFIDSLIKKVDPKVPNVREMVAAEIYQHVREKIEKVERPIKKLAVLSKLLEMIARDPDEFVRQIEQGTTIGAPRRAAEPGPSQ
jgi:hypothetical protein